MDQKQKLQNIAIETIASFAMIGSTQVAWKEVPIYETAAAVGSDPFRHEGRLPDTWIEAVDPKDDASRQVIRLLDRARVRYVRDRGIETETRVAGDGVETQTLVSNDAENVEYFPQPDEMLESWLGRLSQHVDLTRSRRGFFNAMEAYVVQFSGKKFGELSEAEQKVVGAFIEKICAEAA